MSPITTPAPDIYLVKIKMKDTGNVVELSQTSAAGMVDAGYATYVVAPDPEQPKKPRRGA